jgi:hypothetical protein
MITSVNVAYVGFTRQGVVKYPHSTTSYGVRARESERLLYKGRLPKKKGVHSCILAK